MDSNLSSVISKVQKLLALSKSSSAEEAATAAAIANKLIDQYRLSASDFEEASEEVDPMMEDDQSIYETGRIVSWKSNLAIMLSKHYGCAIYNSIYYPNGRKSTRYKLVGRKSDLEITRYMFNWLVLECSRLAEKEAYGRGRVFANSYCEGFVSGVNRQLNQSRQEVQANASQTAIIKMNSRYQESNQFLNDNYKLKKTRASSNSHIDYNAFSAGQSRGQSIHLGSSLPSSKVKLLGS